VEAINVCWLEFFFCEVESQVAPFSPSILEVENVYCFRLAKFLLHASFHLVVKSLQIPKVTDDESTNIALDTIQFGKQIIIFVNSKKGAEALAEKIAGKIKDAEEKFVLLAEEGRTTLPKPTRQCERLALCLKKGVSFHHAGLHTKQRELVEDSFRKSELRVICATPTLAFGLDLPAFRVVVRDLKRFGRRGMEDIAVLEFEQMCGRAGRPGKEDFGEAIAIARSTSEEERIVEKFINGNAEEILSKLAVEPVMRTYVLSLIASELVGNRNELLAFFEKTFYAHHFKNIREIGKIIDKMIDQLDSWEFIRREEDVAGEKGVAREHDATKLKHEKKEDDGFTSAFSIAKSDVKEKEDSERLVATIIGKRVSELYIDPLSAHRLIEGLRRASGSKQRVGPFSFLFLASRQNEIRPQLRVRAKEGERLVEMLGQREALFLENEPDQFGEDFAEFLDAFKTALFFDEWIMEKDEEFLLEKFDIRPGEIHVKLSLLEWLLFCTTELCRMLRFMPLHREISQLRVRVKYGVKEELLQLLRLRGIGRVRARTMFSNGIKTIADIRSVDLARLSNILGKTTAQDVKKQVGEEIVDEQVSLEEWKFDDAGRV
jgi:helicase